ncbi:MAG: stage IV sporulation protein A [Oscillospiraceae bacterium]|nr:stage IV sporulation protein A [Oscillospiraceae bacterium]
MDMAIYRDMAERTGGNVYIGVVGPVRTGKSTFIKRFMETMVLPQVEDVYARERARDELPQSGSGRTVMTAEPKFVPEQAAALELGAGASCSVRMIDSVGYLVDGAAGDEEDGTERMVMTPWYDREIPMRQAAEEGTRRVIADHSTVGILVTTDGSVCGIPREAYEPAEAKAAEELGRIGKPYVILLNCADPASESAVVLAAGLEERYGRRCLPVNCREIDAAGMTEVLRELLCEFPVASFAVHLPAWMDALDVSDPVRKELTAAVLTAAENTLRMGDAAAMADAVAGSEFVSSATVDRLELGAGRAVLSVTLPRQLYYKTISRESGFPIRSDRDLVVLLRSVSTLKEEYERVHAALEQARETGYGIVMPTLEEMTLEEPQIVRQGGRYGVKLKASAPSIHLIQADIETEVSPAIGGERASEEVINFLLQGYDGDINRIWESNIFGKALNDIAGEGLTNKIRAMPADAQSKLRTTVQRIVNEGSGGLICILL